MHGHRAQEHADAHGGIVGDQRVLDLTPVPVEIVVGDAVSPLERYGIPLGLGAGLGALVLLAVD